MPGTGATSLAEAGVQMIVPGPQELAVLAVRAGREEHAPEEQRWGSARVASMTVLLVGRLLRLVGPFAAPPDEEVRFDSLLVAHLALLQIGGEVIP